MGQQDSRADRRLLLSHRATPLAGGPVVGMPTFCAPQSLLTVSGGCWAFNHGGQGAYSRPRRGRSPDYESALHRVVLGAIEAVLPRLQPEDPLDRGGFARRQERRVESGATVAVGVTMPGALEALAPGGLLRASEPVGLDILDEVVL